MTISIGKARSAANKAYCPYSNFHVGAVVETSSGMFSGCNVENASYGLTICAERVAIFKAIYHGEKKILRLTVTCPDADGSNLQHIMPCGACRQVMSEFMDEDSEVVIDIKDQTPLVFKLKDLLPKAFKLR